MLLWWTAIIVVIFAIIVIAAIIQHTQTRQIAATPVHQVRQLHCKTQQVYKSATIWSDPHKTNINGDTTQLMQDPKRFTNQVQPVKEVISGKHKLIDIYRQGKSLGWIPADCLKPVKQYMLPYKYTSQFWPVREKDACEEAALKMALSTQSKAMHANLAQIVAKTPLVKDPNLGYTGDPERYGSHASIFAPAMIRVARQYGAQARNMTGAPEQQFIYEIEHGYATEIECPYMMKKPGSDHDLVIMGYKPGKFFVVDPFTRTPRGPRSTWVSAKRMMALYNRSFRTQEALTIF